jgi:dynein heavy chain
MLESCAKQAEYRSIVFALSYFHAALLERKKFGVGNIPGSTSGIGWNMNYPFNAGDLICCGQTANNYLENNVKVREPYSMSLTRALGAEVIHYVLALSLMGPGR